MGPFLELHVSKALFATPALGASCATARRCRRLTASLFDPYVTSYTTCAAPGRKWRESNARDAGFAS